MFSSPPYTSAASHIHLTVSQILNEVMVLLRVGIFIMFYPKEVIALCHTLAGMFIGYISNHNSIQMKA